METDLSLLTAVLCTPAAFGVVLLLFRPGWLELTRWWALFATGITLALSLVVLIGFYARLDQSLDAGGRPLHALSTQLDARSDAALSAANAAVPRPRLPDDWVARLPWIDALNAHYAIGVDGLSMALIVLTNVVMLLAVVASWNVTDKVRGYYFLLLTLQTGVIGAFLALDLLLFYVFYELMLVPMYLLIGIWGGERRKQSALKFVLYTLFGSVLILTAIVGLSQTDVTDVSVPEVVDRAVSAEGQRQGVNMPMRPTKAKELIQAEVAIRTLDIVTLQKAGAAARKHLNGETVTGLDARRAEQPLFKPWGQYLFFGLLFVGFAVKVPLWPLHSWLPDAHVEAPTPVSMVLAGILLKLGGYGLMRFAWPICPWAAEQLAWWLGLAAVVSILLGALLAMAQTDFKKMLAYSSVSHMGYVVLGLSAWTAAAGGDYWIQGVTGAAFQMVAHGITAAGLFFAVGVVYERAHHRDLNRLGGLMEPMPLFTGLSAVLLFGSMALPGLCGFVGEILVTLSAWKLCPLLASGAIVGTVLTAGYLLWTWLRVYTGTNPETAGYADVGFREALVLTLLALLTIVLGVVPSLVLTWLSPATSHFVERLVG